LSTWSWISRDKERRALRLYIEHVSRVLNVVEHATEALKAYHAGNWEKFSEEWRKVFDLEREADEIKRKILAELSQEVFHPIDREEVIRLVITSDDVASHAKAWTRRLGYVHDDVLPKGIVERFIEIAKNVQEATTLIKEASKELLAGHKEKALELADRIEVIEERVDDMRVETLKEVFSYCDSARISYCLLAKEVVDILEDAADKCEDVADVLRSIALLRR